MVDTFLFHDWQTFQQALFPSAHTFLLKWPLFLVLAVLGATPNLLAIATVGLSLVTVLGLAYIMYRIDSRLVVWGTLILALASVFVLVPAQPYAGGLLPVNFAMIATRNVEYLAYIVAIYLLIRWRGLKQIGFWAGLVLLGLLFASDHLFVTIAVGGALLAMLTHVAIHRRKPEASLLRWLMVTIAATVVSMLIVWIIMATGLTHISSQSDAPFKLVTTPKEVALGTIFGLLGFATNFGANPAFDVAELRQIPVSLMHRLFGFSGVSFVANALLLVGGLFATWHVWRKSIVLSPYSKKLPAKAASHSTTHKKTKKPSKASAKRSAMVTAMSATTVQPFRTLTRPEQLASILIWSSLASCVAFIMTDHYYVVDARYLSIAVFAVAIAAACYLRTRTFPVRRLYAIGAALICTTALGFVAATTTHQREQRALQPIKDRNTTIVEALRHRAVEAVVGDYWRVMPLKLQSPGLRVIPLDDCGQTRHILSSTHWELPNLKKHSFAYMLSFDKSLTNYPNCSLDQLLKIYGRPSSSVLIKGRPDQPTELLLFYVPAKKKITLPRNAKTPPPTSTILPIGMNEYPYTTCAKGKKTIINVVAHQDDDLLFLSPDLLQSIRSGDCVRTVYVTAGDAGSGQLYWLSRERGSMAAYDTMTHNTVPWTGRTIKTPTGQFFSITNPRGNAKYSLVFLHLPDGNISGQGFRDSHYQSLGGLTHGSIDEIQAVDGQSTYTMDSLEQTLQLIIDNFKPDEIRTQAPYNESHEYPDHSDHMNVGRLVNRVYERYEAAGSTKLSQYVGYPIRSQLSNVEGQDLADKMAAFLAYAKYDDAVCQSESQCDETPSYGSFLGRQITIESFEGR